MQSIDNIRETWAQMALSLNEISHLYKKARKTNTFPDQDEIDKLRTFQVIGGGATGIECAFEMQAMLGSVIDHYYPELKEEHFEKFQPRIIIYEANQQLLPGFSDRERNEVKKTTQSKSY